MRQATGRALLKLRLPTALPFIFNGLKICTTLALIGAIVAEFFGSPIVGMGFRIKIEVGRLAMDMVWASKLPWPRWRARRSTGLWP
jgi:NitT/TauT family transport system permease protein